jgi:aspartyl-tRNA synthetase
MTQQLNPTYRTHTCGQLSAEHVGTDVTLAGWIYRKRDHGGLAFVDLRDHFGITQLVFDPENAGKKLIDEVTHLSLESVVKITGKVVRRDDGQVNAAMPTGQVEVDVTTMDILSRVDQIPYNITDATVPEEMRLKYRFMDLRTERMHTNIQLRSAVIMSLRRRMWAQGFQEIQTPILTSSSPEGARDYLVPSRLHPGQFYALPQAPQQFKQMLMMAGFDKYFQIAPCFRDEDARADRTPGDFYQLDMEMSFVEQEDIFELNEKVLGEVFEEFLDWQGKQRRMDPTPWRKISYAEAMLKYASDKPDLRCPLEILDVSGVFEVSDFAVFKDIVKNGGFVRAIPAPGATKQSRKWFDDIGRWAQKELGAPAAPGYISWVGGEFKGPLAKFLEKDQLRSIFEQAGLKSGDVLFFVAADEPLVYKLAGPLRVKIGEELELNETDVFRFCWIVDFPMFERDEETRAIDFSHNPFSMPQGGLKALEEQNPLEVKALQYDLVCNGFELSSGAIRNHLPEVMYKAFGIAGYSAEEVDKKFGGMIRALKLGAPPHGGFAPGIDRIVMLLAETPNIREVIAFPLTQRGEDLLMGAPAPASEQQLKELFLQHRKLPREETS